MVSRVARNPIPVPAGVQVTYQAPTLKVKGKLGELTQDIHPLVNLQQADDTLQFLPADASHEANALTGTMSALTKNMVHGVAEGFVKELTLVGVGYRAKAQGKVLDLTVGMSHPVKVTMPEGVTVETPSQTEVKLSGVDKQLVNQVAANIRRIRPPEPYKGKGIRYKDETIILKEVKKK